MEVGLIGYIFFDELAGGIFNFKTFTWLFIVFVRVMMYLSMCCDGIAKRRRFMWALIFTTIVEAVMFTIMNYNLLDGTSQELIFRVAANWGWSSAVKIFVIELVTVIHLAMFTYFSAIAYEYYSMAADDP